MPRAKSVPSSPGRRAYESLWAEQTGSPLDFELLDWDPKPGLLFDAVAQVLSTGAQLFVRSGSGGRSMSIAIWEGDDRHPATFFHEVDELDAWCRRIIEKGKEIRAKHEEGRRA